MTLSVIVIAKNEAHAIRECLESVCWADEIIVLDSGSTDGTVAICREFTPHVHSTDWPGFGPQKNRALALATGDWVLSLDADERVPEPLRTEIQAAMESGRHDAYRMSRLSSYCGRFMRHGGWWPDYVTRLFRREKWRFSDDLVHERVIVSGETGTLQNHLIHLTYRNLEEVLDKVNSYSSSGALSAARRNKRGSLEKAIFRGFWAFLRTYLLRAGFLDGREGFMLAVSNAEVTYYRYLKLMYLRETNR
jgi:glycosyltransferase involved in cell wall biosynthesis